jgi:hypothetical protein
VVLSLAVLALFAAGLLLYHYIPDDTFITLRYARNVVRGDGFVWNAGERVEGYTNFLWLLIVAAAGKLGAPMPGAARALSLLFSLATLVVAGASAAARARDRASGENVWRDSLAIVLAPLLLAAAPPFLVYSMSGTEMPLFAFLLLAGCLLFERGGRPAAVFVVLALAALTRPEGTLFYAIAFAALLARHSNRRAVLLAGALVAAIFLAPHAVWKWRYYHALLPNTFYAKTGPPALMLANGAGYLTRFLVAHGYLFPAGLLLLRSAGRPWRELAVPAVFVSASWLAVLALGGDWMPHFRMLLPTLPIVVLLASRGAAAAARGPRLAPAAAILVCLTMLSGAFGRDLFLAERVTVTAYTRLGARLAEILPPGTTIGCGSTGAIGYYTGMPVLDILGLTDRWIARHGAVVATQPGHLKTDGAYVVEKRPDLLLLGNVQIQRGRKERGEIRIKVQEREIVRQPSFDELYQFVNIPLGGGFYLSCFKLRDYFLPLEPPQ